MCVRVIASYRGSSRVMFSRKLLFAIAAGIATALLSYFGTGLHPIWPFLWFAPVPVLAIGPRLTATRAFLLAFVAWFAGG